MGVPWRQLTLSGESGVYQASPLSHLSGHYRSKVVHGWCPPPVQFQSGILGLDSDVTGEVLNEALRKAVAVLGSRPPPLNTVSSAVGSCL